MQLAVAARTQPDRVAILLRESGEAKKKWHPAKKSINQNPQRVELFIHNVLKRFIAIMIKYIVPTLAWHLNTGEESLRAKDPERKGLSWEQIWFLTRHDALI